jgi:hypothetical protein
VHPSENGLKSDTGKLFVKYLPSAVTTLIQVINQGVISAKKRLWENVKLTKVTDMNEGGGGAEIVTHTCRWHLFHA